MNSLRPQSGVMGLLIACMSGDVAVDGHSNPLLVRIHLRKSKADQLGRRLNIYLGRTDEDLCPVTTLLAYLAVCGMEPGPLFELSNGHFLTKQTFSARVRSALSVLDYACSSYAGHSFMIGARLQQQQSVALKIRLSWQDSWATGELSPSTLRALIAANLKIGASGSSAVSSAKYQVVIIAIFIRCAVMIRSLDLQSVPYM